MKKQIPTYNISDERKIKFRVIPIEEIKAKYENKPHRHNFYEIIWFTSSCNEILVDFNYYQSQKNTVFFLTQGRVTKFDTTDKKGFFIVFSKDFISEKTDLLHSLFMNFYNTPFVLPNANNIIQLNLILQLMKSESSQQNPDYEILKSYLISFLLNIQNMQHKSDSIKIINIERIIQLYQLIETNFTTEHRSEFYAYNLNLTIQQTNRIVKEQVGKTITQLIHERLVLEAKRQILLSKKNIKEITYMLGFEDPAYFSRFIKKHTGSSPEMLKKEMFKKYK